MPLDIAVLATTVVGSFLLPYLKQGAEEIAKSVTEKVSKEAAGHVTGVTQKLWEKVKSIFSSNEDKVTLSNFEKYPDETKALFELMLKKKLEANPSLATELDKLVNDKVPGGTSTGAQIMNAGIAGIVDARNANFSGASGFEISGNKFGEFPAKVPTPPKADKSEEDS